MAQVLLSKYHYLHNPKNKNSAIYYNQDDGNMELVPEIPSRVDWLREGLREKKILLEEVGVRMTDVFKNEISIAFSKVHPTGNLDSLEDALEAELNETYYSGQGTVQAVKNAVITSCMAVNKTINSGGYPTFAVVRPPGHHVHKKARGFCWRNNTLIAAVYASLKYNNIMIIDIDFHYGGGVEKAMLTDTFQEYMEKNQKKFLYVSMHHESVYDDPYETKDASDELLYISDEEALNKYIYRFISGKDDDTAIDVTNRLNDNLTLIENLVTENKVDAIIIAAGFDNTSGETMGENSTVLWTEEDIGTLATRIREIASKTTMQGTVSILEGGYNQSTMKNIVPLFIDTLCIGTEYKKKNKRKSKNVQCDRKRNSKRKNTTKQSDSSEWVVKKVIDTKLDNNLRFYRVVWEKGEKTWEPENNLLGKHINQHLIDFVRNSKRFIVEKVIKSKKVKGIQMYRVKWIGIDKETWETENNKNLMSIKNGFIDEQFRKFLHNQKLYIVESIIDKQNNNTYTVKWLGYQSPNDYTTEKESYLQQIAPNIIEEYIKKNE